MSRDEQESRVLRRDGRQSPGEEGHAAAVIQCWDLCTFTDASRDLFPEEMDSPPGPLTGQEAQVTCTFWKFTNALGITERCLACLDLILVSWRQTVMVLWILVGLGPFDGPGTSSSLALLAHTASGQDRHGRGVLSPPGTYILELMTSKKIRILPLSL